MEEEVTMNARLFRLMEARQRIDRALQGELKCRRPDPLRTSQLKTLRIRVKELMHRLTRRTALA
jgi:hypothetical protein